MMLTTRATFDRTVVHVEQVEVYAHEHDAEPDALVAMDNALARRIAARWHGGQRSALYSFTSTGRATGQVLTDAIHEVRSDLKVRLGHTSTPRRNRCENDTPTADLVELALLLDYLDSLT